MFKKIAAAAVLTGGMLVMGGVAYADSSALTDFDYQQLKFAAKHGQCSVQDHTRVCTNFNSNGSN